MPSLQKYPLHFVKWYDNLKTDGKFSVTEGESKMNNNGNSNNGDNQSCSSQQKTNEQQDKGILDKTYEEITATIGSARSSDNITIPKSLVVKGILVALGIHFFF